MLLTPDCILCSYKASLAAIRELTADEALVKELMSDVLQIPALRGLDWTKTSPAIFETVLRKITSALGNPDPFKSWKDRQNQKGLALYPRLKPVVDGSVDPLATALNVAIMGNSLDVMWSGGSVDVEPLIRDKLSRSLPAEQVAAFKGRISRSRLVVYITDNCGEIALDRLLIETMRQSTSADVVVRSEPTLNDATIADAIVVGLPEVATVIENGIDGPVPGTILNRCSQEVRASLDEASFIISKGGGNFDSLDEDKQIEHKLCYMLMCKCEPYRRHFDTPLNHPILSVGPIAR
jgi:uncharacterized protein with ATP-grasp and redox domains